MTPGGQLFLEQWPGSINPRTERPWGGHLIARSLKPTTPENIMSLLPSVLLRLLRVHSTSSNANGNKRVIFSRYGLVQWRASLDTDFHVTCSTDTDSHVTCSKKIRAALVSSPDPTLPESKRVCLQYDTPPYLASDIAVWHVEWPITAQPNRFRSMVPHGIVNIDHFSSPWRWGLGMRLVQHQISYTPPGTYVTGRFSVAPNVLCVEIAYQQ